MQRFAWNLVLAIVACSVVACSSSKKSAGDAKTIRVAAASSMSRAFTDLGKAFETETGIKAIFDFGSSGLLAKQIEQGAPYQLFAAANRKFAEQAIATGKCDASSEALYARGRLVVWGKSGSPAKLEDLVDPRFKRIGIANPDHAPYGGAALQALERAGIYDQVKARIVMAENIQGTMAYAKEGSVDVAIVAMSLVIENEAKDYLPIELDLHDPLEQTMVVCGTGPATDAARKLASYIVGAKGQAIMERYGFSTTGVLPPK